MPSVCHSFRCWDILATHDAAEEQLAQAEIWYTQMMDSGEGKSLRTGDYAGADDFMPYFPVMNVALCCRPLR